MFSEGNSTAAVSCCSMKRLLLSAVFLLMTILTYSQSSDFIVLKKRNNRTLKTYYPGVYLSAVTYNKFSISGTIKAIRNDSIIFQQEVTRLEPTEFGSKVDTFRYSMGVDYHEIERFNFTVDHLVEPRKSLVNELVPKLMIIGGIGYIVLELVNSAYRGESLSDQNKLAGLGIAAGIAIAGFVWQKTVNESDKAGGKYKVVYVKMHSQGF